MKKDKLTERVWNCLKEMYSIAQPPLDLLGSPEEFNRVVKPKGEWFSNHYLSIEDYQKILDKYLKYTRRRDRVAISFYIMNWSPTSEKED